MPEQVAKPLHKQILFYKFYMTNAESTSVSTPYIFHQTDSLKEYQSA